MLLSFQSTLQQISDIISAKAPEILAIILGSGLGWYLLKLGAKFIWAKIKNHIILKFSNPLVKKLEKFEKKLDELDQSINSKVDEIPTKVQEENTKTATAETQKKIELYKEITNEEVEATVEVIEEPTVEPTVEEKVETTELLDSEISVLNEEKENVDKLLNETQEVPVKANNKAKSNKKVAKRVIEGE